jgi:hypothetical protein
MPDNRSDPVNIPSFDFLKDRYDFELERKNTLTGDLALPIGVLSGLGGLAATMARSFSYKIPFLTVAFVVFFGLAAIGFLMCLVLLGRAYLAQTYEYLPLLADLDQSAEEFREFTAYVRNTGGEVEDPFAGELRQRIIKAADRNTLSNDLRAKWLHHSRIMLFVVLGFTALAVVPYVADERINMRNVMPTPEAPKPAAQKTTTPAPAPQRPTFPENRVIREGQEPGNVKKKPTR